MHQLNNAFSLTMGEKFFETLGTAYFDTTTTHYSNIIKPIVNRHFDNTFHHQNVPNQSQHLHKHKGQ